MASVASDWFIYQQYSVANKAQIDNREQLRAVINQAGGNINIALDKDKNVVGILATPFFQNFGGTRTDWFHGWVSGHYFDGLTPPENLDLSKPWDKVDLSDTIIAANAVAQISVGIQAQDAANFLAGKGVILLWGRAQYADIFDKKTVHEVSTCLLISKREQASGATPQANYVLDFHPYKAECNYSR